MNTVINISGAKAKRIRESKGLSIRELSNQTGLAYPALNKIENGLQKMDLDTLTKLAQFYEVPFEYFLREEVKIGDVVTTSVLEERMTNLMNSIEHVLANYTAEKQQPLKGNALGNFVRNDLVEAIYDAFAIDRQKYLVDASVGKGNWATIPWVCIFDRSVTVSATTGFYIVLLVKKDMSGFYLSFNQGYTYFKEKYKAKLGRQKIKQTAKIIRELIEAPEGLALEEIDLASTNDLAVGYESGHIFGKYYSAGNLPDGYELKGDFEKLLDIYQKVVHFMNGRSVDQYNDFLLSKDDEEFLEGEEEEYQEKANETAKEIEEALNNSKKTALKEDVEKELNEGPRPPKKTITQQDGKQVYPRNAKEAALALYLADYQCEMDVNHETFISKATKRNFTEAHHLVPLAQHANFLEVDLDRAANIVSLCPVCHKRIHHSEDKEKLQMVNALLKKRKDKLEQVGIEVTLTQLKAFYGIDPTTKLD